MSIASLAEVKIFLDIEPVDNSQDYIIEPIHNGVDGWVKGYLRWDPEATTHVNKLYDGNGYTSLFLDEMYISAVKQVSTARTAAIKIKNTSTDATNAYITVGSTAVVLTVLGGDDVDSDEVDFATYTTLSAVVTQINTIGGGWTSEIYDTDFNGILSTELLEVFNMYCGSRAVTTASWEYLDIPDEPVSFRLYQNRGEIYCPGGFPEGHRNIAISYTSGYSTTTMPDDLKLAEEIAVKHWYDRWDQESFNFTEYSTGHTRIHYADVLPEESRLLLSKHKKFGVF
jgi:hypothetical protein